MTVGTIADRELMVGGLGNALDVSGYFSEPDGQVLAYAVAVSDSSRLTATVAGAVLTVVAVAKGDVVVTVTATDPGGLSATQSFVVTVPNRPPMRGRFNRRHGSSRSTRPTRWTSPPSSRTRTATRFFLRGRRVGQRLGLSGGDRECRGRDGAREG